MNRGSLPRLDHPGQVVQGRVHVGAADRLDERAGHVVVLVAVAVVLHRGAVDGRLDRLQGDLRLPRGDGRTGRRLQCGERPPRVAAGDPQQMGLGVLGQGDRAAEPPLLDERPAQERAQVVVGQRLQGEQQGAREQRRDDREVRVLRGGGDEGDPAVLHGGEQGVLLGLGEAVDLVQEEDGLLAESAGRAPRALDDGPDLLDARGDRGELDEPFVGGLADHVRQSRLAGAGRAPEDDGGRPGRTPAALADQAAQRRARLQQVLLADHLVEGARTHPDGERTARRVLLLAVFGGCGKEVGLHVMKPKRPH